MSIDRILIYIPMPSFFRYNTFYMDRMPSILQDIVKCRRDALRRDGHAQASTLPNARTVPIVPFCVSPTVICEIKRKSPSRAEFAGTFQPVQQARHYVEHGAQACSVLTEQHYFGGQLTDLQRIKECFPHISVLRKDFLLDEEDVAVSHRAGADAVLLIAAILPAAQLQKLHRAAHRLGMRALVEVHTKEEIDRIRPLAPPLVGVNCRDLHTFQVDTLRPLSLARHIDWECTLVFESGIFHAEQVAMARRGGFSSVLVGGAVMHNHTLIPQMIHALTQALPSPASFWNAIARMIHDRQTVGVRRPLVKICGITNIDDAMCATECGADILGVVLCTSPRQANIEFVPTLKRLNTLTVGVVDGEAPPSDEVRGLCEDGYLDALQVHGGEVYPRGEGLGCPYYQALRVHSPAQYRGILESEAPRTLLDSYSAQHKGGTGVAMADELIAEYPQKECLWLAGGVDGQRVGGILARHRPELIDSSSRLESRAGKKDHAKVKYLFSEIDRVCGV